MKKLFLLFAAACCTMGAMAKIIAVDLPDSYNIDGSPISLSVQVYRVMANGATVTNSYLWQTRDANSLTWEDVTPGTIVKVTTSGVKNTITGPCSTSMALGKIRCIVTQNHSVNGITRDTSNVCTFVCNPVNVEVSTDELLYTADDEYACSDKQVTVSFDPLYVGTASVQWYNAYSNTKISGETSATFTQNVCDYLYDSIYAVVSGSKGDVAVKSPIVYIGKSYEMKVLGQLVTSRNADDILGDGTVWFEDDTLYMKGLDYQTTDKYADTALVESEVSLAVRCIGMNRAVLGFDGAGLLVNSSSRLSLTGDTLILQTGDASGLAIHEDMSAGFGTIVVKDMQWLEVHHVGAGDGISGGFDDQDKINDVLELDNCNIRVRSIDFFGKITMADNIEFKEPAGLYIGQYTNGSYTRMSVLAADGTQQWGNYSQSEGESDYIVIGVKANALESTEAADGAQKILRNGQVLILRDGRTYNVLGAELK